MLSGGPGIATALDGEFGHHGSELQASVTSTERSG